MLSFQACHDLTGNSLAVPAAIAALGRSESIKTSESELADQSPNLLGSPILKPYLPNGLELTDQVIEFRSESGRGGKGGMSLGYPAELLPILGCLTVQKCANFLQKNTPSARRMG